MVMITLYARQQKRHRCIEQSFGLCGRGGGWDELGEWHETCIISHKKQITSLGSMQDTGCLRLVHWDDSLEILPSLYAFCPISLKIFIKLFKSLCQSIIWVIYSSLLIDYVTLSFLAC